MPDKAKKLKSITESKDCAEPKLKIMYTNTDQLTVKKLEELRLKARVSKPQIIAECEVNSKREQGQSSQEYSIKGYVMYTVNLNKFKSRGIIIYVKEELSGAVTEH